MNVKRILRKVIDRRKITVTRTEMAQTLNYILNLEREVRRLSNTKGVMIEITVEDR
jgi:polyhydroxyalkanoate synthesis regulator phasin